MCDLVGRSWHVCKCAQVGIEMVYTVLEGYPVFISLQLHTWLGQIRLHQCLNLPAERVVSTFPHSQRRQCQSQILCPLWGQSWGSEYIPGVHLQLPTVEPTAWVHVLQHGNFWLFTRIAWSIGEIRPKWKEKGVHCVERKHDSDPRAAD